MYDINVKNIVKGKTFWYIFLFAGVLFLVIFAGIIISENIKLNSLDASVEAKKIDVNSYYQKPDSDGEGGGLMYLPIYYYEVDGKTYQCISNSSSNVEPSDNKKSLL